MLLPHADFQKWCKENKAESQLVMVLASKPGITAAEWWATTNRSDWMLWLLEAVHLHPTPEFQAEFEALTKPLWDEFSKKSDEVDKERDRVCEPERTFREARIAILTAMLEKAEEKDRVEATEIYRQEAAVAWKRYRSSTKTFYMKAKQMKASLRAPCRQAESDALRLLIGNPFA